MVDNRCQIFTPESYVDKMLDAIEYKGEEVLGRYILENSCGEGNILKKVITRYIEASKKLRYSNEKIKEDLEKYIIGFEIDAKTMKKCVYNLNLEVSKYGISGVNWNIRNEDYLRYPINNKVDFIVGNPPYIMYQNLKESDRIFLRQSFASCKIGKFDYCYAFIDKSIKELGPTGRMSYIVPNSIFKNVYAKELRNIMMKFLEVVYDYRESVVFESVLTSPAIICINKKDEKSYIQYHDIDNQKEYHINKRSLGEKWVFSHQKSNIKLAKSQKFGDFFKVSNSVATLLNSAFVINKNDIILEDEKYIKTNRFLLEKGILRPAASPRSYTLNREEYIIFPYQYIDSNLRRFEEEELKITYPGVYEYLSTYSEQLKARASDKSAKWYEYGRSQALLHLNQEKIIMSSVMTNEVKVYRMDKNTIPYSGFYIIPVSDKSLDEAEEVLKSDDFNSYLSIRGINANGKSLRFSVNDILNYPLN